MIKKVLGAAAALFIIVSSASAGSLTVKVTDSSYIVPDMAVTVKSAQNSWSGRTGKDGALRINDVPEGDGFGIVCDRGDTEPIYISGMYFPSDGSDLFVSVEYDIVYKGDYYAVRMPSNPSTGYSWEIIWQDVSNSLTYQDKTYETPDTRPASQLRSGTGGTEKWVFKATGLGRTQILFGYRRSWERPARPVRYHICTVISKTAHKQQ